MLCLYWIVNVFSMLVVQWWTSYNYMPNQWFIASMGIEEFMHLSSGMNRQVSDDILQHILGCVYDNSSDQLSPVFVNNSCEPVPGDIRISTDIDSFAYVSSDLPLKHSCTLDIRPPYSSSYTTDTGVAWSHERYTNDVKVGVHKISNVQFLHSERLQVLFFFFEKTNLKESC